MPLSQTDFAAPGPTVAVVGGGPAGLMAAETLSAAGVKVTVFERMPSLGRKLLMAGRGGLNLTHSEPLASFVRRYGEAGPRLQPLVERFAPQDLVAWAEGLGQATFAGTSGRVFPKAFKASPLLRAWIGRLQGQGVEFRMRWIWRGWDDEGRLLFDDQTGQRQAIEAGATVLALGGGSWPKLGSDGAWVDPVGRVGVQIAPLQPANCGVDIGWSEVFRQRFAGQPLKNVRLAFQGQASRGDALVAAYGLEGGAVYPLSSLLREAIAAGGRADLDIDLRPDLAAEALAARLDRPRGGMSTTNFLRKTAGLSLLEIGLLREAAGPDLPREPRLLAAAIKAVRLPVTGLQPLARAISSAGGVRLDELDEQLMLRARPGVFAAGEMLDWEAPTGGYLLQGAFATGRAAGLGALTWLGKLSI